MHPSYPCHIIFGDDGEAPPFHKPKDQSLAVALIVRGLGECAWVGGGGWVFARAKGKMENVFPPYPWYIIVESFNGILSIPCGKGIYLSFGRVDFFD